MSVITTNFKGSLYRSLSPVFPKSQEQMARPIYLGMHCRCLEDLNLIDRAHLPVNIIEVKPEYFRNGGNLFYFEGSQAKVNLHMFGRLKQQCDQLGLKIQFHFPAELGNQLLNPGVKEQHPAMFSLFETLAGVICDYGLLPTITMHPPFLMYNGIRYFRSSPQLIGRLLGQANQFLLKLSDQRISRGWPIIIGIENQADPKKDADVLGFKLAHLQKIVASTPDFVGFTIDAGHRLLSDYLSVTDILNLAFGLGKRVVNLHFHENAGKVSDSYKDDQHCLPHGSTMHGFMNYLNRAVQDRIPVVLEIRTHPYNDAELLVNFTAIYTLLQQIEAERKVVSKQLKAIR